MKNNSTWQPPTFGEKKENEVTCYTVAIGNFNPFAIGRQKRDQEKILNIIKKQEGFIGVYPCYPNGTLLLFKTKNNAKVAKNVLDSYYILTGKNVSEVYIDKSYLD